MLYPTRVLPSPNPQPTHRFQRLMPAVDCRRKIWRACKQAPGTTCHALSRLFTFWPFAADGLPPHLLARLHRNMHPFSGCVRKLGRVGVRVCVRVCANPGTDLLSNENLLIYIQIS